MSTGPTAFQVHAADNVATLLDHADAGTALRIIGAAQEKEITAQEAIALGHKIAVAPIAEGAEVTKFGVVIGIATRAIAPGVWVHLHNCRSQLDERSGSFDLHTGAPGDNAHG